jgi:ATP-dependent exoDNAse (exonuclease V) beta subunit
VSGGASDADDSVSVGDFQSGPDEDQAAREREETKRLLYVALTRARDRLYLSAVTNDGCLQPGRGSLAEVLPSSLLAQLVPMTDAPIRWKASSGAVHVLRVCEPRAAEGAPLDAVWEQPSAEIEPSVESDFAPVELGSGLESPLFSRSDPQTVKKVGIQDLTPSRLRGRLVHRLLVRFGLTTAWEGSAVTDAAAALIRPVERTGELDLSEVIADACAAYRTLAERADLREIFRVGLASYEVPFSLVIEGAPVRGTIDCLIQAPEPAEPSAGRPHVTILEFKTGPARAGHTEQATLYRRAAEMLFPGARVDAHLVYPAGLDQMSPGAQS